MEGFAQDAYDVLMDTHEWTYEEVIELMELLDKKQMELSSCGPEEVILPDYESDYMRVHEENGRALID